MSEHEKAISQEYERYVSREFEAYVKEEQDKLHIRRVPLVDIFGHTINKRSTGSMNKKFDWVVFLMGIIIGTTFLSVLIVIFDLCDKP